VIEDADDTVKRLESIVISTTLLFDTIVIIQVTVEYFVGQIDFGKALG